MDSLVNTEDHVYSRINFSLFLNVCCMVTSQKNKKKFSSNLKLVVTQILLERVAELHKKLAL